MSMSTSGPSGGAVADINVTPLIDVLLVLLIIFMVIVPITPKGLQTLVPQPPKDKTQSNDDPNTIVVQVISNGGGQPSYKINQDDYAKAGIAPKLEEIFSTRSTKVMFIKGSPDLDFSKIAEVIDWGHQAGVDNIGLITPGVEASAGQ